MRLWRTIQVVVLSVHAYHNSSARVIHYFQLHLLECYAPGLMYIQLEMRCLRHWF